MPIGRSAIRSLGGALFLVMAVSMPVSAAQTIYWNDGTTSGASSDDATGCAVEIREVQDGMREQVINSRITLAKEFYSILPEEGFSELSCLERLLNGGMDIFFTPPTLGDLLGMLKNAICKKAESLMHQATRPLERSLNASLPVGEIIPGVNLGSINGGVAVRPRTGTGETGPVVITNLNSVLSGGATNRRDTYAIDELVGGLYDEQRGNR